MTKEIPQQKIQEIKKLPINSVDEAEAVASKLFDILHSNGYYDMLDESFFVAGFIECYKFLKIAHE
jgi:hypothetical protein